VLLATPPVVGGKDKGEGAFVLLLLRQSVIAKLALSNMIENDAVGRCRILNFGDGR